MSEAPGDDVVERALALFGGGFNCAEAIAGAFAERVGASREVALKAACAFGGGMSRTGQTCGAVTGALIVLGLARGRTAPEHVGAKERTYAGAGRLCVLFAAEHGSLGCSELLGLDISDPEGMRQANATGLFRTRCPEFVRSAARLLAAELGT